MTVLTADWTVRARQLADELTAAGKLVSPEWRDAVCVPAVPWAWVTQTRRGGVILTDLKIANGAGSLVRLTRLRDGAEGHFDPTYAAFMGLRHQPANQTPARRRPIKDRTRESELRTTTLDPRTPWTSLVVWFIAGFDLGFDLSLGYTGFGLTVTEDHQRVWCDSPEGSHTWSLHRATLPTTPG